jgi:hypothetical protein
MSTQSLVNPPAPRTALDYTTASNMIKKWISDGWGVSTYSDILFNHQIDSSIYDYLKPLYDTARFNNSVWPAVQEASQPTTCSGAIYYCHAQTMRRALFDPVGNWIASYYDPVLGYGTTPDTVTRNPVNGDCICPDSIPYYPSNNNGWCSPCPSARPFYYNDNTTEIPTSGGVNGTVSNWCHRVRKGQCETPCNNPYYSQNPPSTDPDSCECQCTALCTTPPNIYVNPVSCTCQSTPYDAVCKNGTLTAGEECDLSATADQKEFTFKNPDPGTHHNELITTAYQNFCENCAIFRKVWCSGLPVNGRWATTDPTFIMKHSGSCTGLIDNAHNTQADFSNYKCAGSEADDGWTLANPSQKITAVLESSGTPQDACLYKF